MEDAKITQENEQNNLYQQGRFPSVVTTDDLVFELGKQVVERINKEKLLDGLLKKKQEAENQIVDIEKIKADHKNRVSVLEDSNQRYEKNNRGLGDELVKIRQDLTSKTNEVAQMIERYEGKLKELNEKLENKKVKKPRKKKDLING